MKSKKSTPCCIDIEAAVGSTIKKKMTRLYKKLSALSGKAFVKAIDRLPKGDLVLLAEFDEPKRILGTKYTRLTKDS